MTSFKDFDPTKVRTFTKQEKIGARSYATNNEIDAPPFLLGKRFTMLGEGNGGLLFADKDEKFKRKYPKAERATAEYEMSFGVGTLPTLLSDDDTQTMNAERKELATKMYDASTKTMLRDLFDARAGDYLPHIDAAFASVRKSAMHSAEGKYDAFVAAAREAERGDMTPDAFDKLLKSPVGKQKLDKIKAAAFDAYLEQDADMRARFDDEAFAEFLSKATRVPLSPDFFEWDDAARAGQVLDSDLVTVNGKSTGKQFAYYCETKVWPRVPYMKKPEEPQAPLYSKVPADAKHYADVYDACTRDNLTPNLFRYIVDKHNPLVQYSCETRPVDNDPNSLELVRPVRDFTRSDGSVVSLPDPWWFPVKGAVLVCPRFVLSPMATPKYYGIRVDVSMTLRIVANDPSTSTQADDTVAIGDASTSHTPVASYQFAGAKRSAPDDASMSRKRANVGDE